MVIAAVGEWAHPGSQTLGVGVGDQAHAAFCHHAGAVGIHVLELPARVDVQQGKRWRCGIKRLASQVQHDRAVLADGVHHHRIAPCGHGLADDFDGFGLEGIHCSIKKRFKVLQQSDAAPHSTSVANGLLHDGAWFRP